MTNQIYSEYAGNPSLTIAVYESTSQAEITSLNPLTYTSAGNTLTYNCFQINGIQGGNSYDLTINLSEDNGSVVYGPYRFNVLNPSTPVFVEKLNDSLAFVKQEINIDQLPDVYPSGTTVSVTLADGSAIPSNIMNLDPTMRTMTYYFDSPTAGSVSSFVLIFTLTSPTGQTRNYKQSITFNEISDGAWFNTPPPNQIAPIGI